MEGYMTTTAHFLDANWEHNSFVLDIKPTSGENADEACHTAYTLAKELKNVCTKWETEGKITAVVNDNMSNVKTLGKLALNASDVPCVAHTMQLAINAGLESFLQLKNLCAAVSHFNRSTVVTGALSEKQKQMGLTQQKLLQACPTQWNSMHGETFGTEIGSMCPP
ncbi:Zinc finger BED domain-containing protein 4 [Holothuria leucospilota]|uniref:Zinc finger BED domain-containing protein 4 n=1 Tax=Holothuria leucospilota TaxID=206669 RepID=A0A9Q1BFB3_HOLLE|nr:Zinc finger BED domain-containing protein 4 [Holothuria leucospilota]